jgi:hypothetical protein
VDDTSAHGSFARGECGGKLAPGVLDQLISDAEHSRPIPSDLLVGIETRDDAAVYRISDDQAIVATADFFMPIVDDAFDFGAIAATNAVVVRLSPSTSADNRVRAPFRATDRCTAEDERRPMLAFSR